MTNLCTAFRPDRGERLLPGARNVSEARRNLAKQYLPYPSLEINEAACLLGYENPNSFFRAFREWEGSTPGQWKAARLKIA
jgi:AraC-like DNA-binding protein